MKKLKSFGKATIETIVFCIVCFLVMAGVVTLSSNTSPAQSVITVKPATPKVTITKAFKSYYNVQDEVAEYIRANAKNGYILKAVSCFEEDGKQRAVVHMEKY